MNGRYSFIGRIALYSSASWVTCLDHRNTFKFLLNTTFCLPSVPFEAFLSFHRGGMHAWLNLHLIINRFKAYSFGWDSRLSLFISNKRFLGVSYMQKACKFWNVILTNRYFMRFQVVNLIRKIAHQKYWIIFVNSLSY